MNEMMAPEQILTDLPPEPEETLDPREGIEPPEVVSKDEEPPEQILGQSGDAEDVEPEKEEAPSYEPNFKYNVQSKEYEFDDRLKGIIKDKESEDYVRDLVTRSHGLDTYKTKLSEKEQAFNEIEESYNEVKTTAHNLERGFERLEQLKNADLSSFVQAWGISDAQVLDLAKAIIQQDENPALRSQRQTQFQNVIQGWQQQDQQQMAQAQMSQESVRLHEMEMELAMSKPEVSEFQSAYDRTRGKEGAFMDLVRTYGSAEWNKGNQLSPRECVKAVMEEFGAFIPKQEPQPIAQPQAVPQGTANPKPLPNMGSGKTGSPVKRKVSWEQLKQIGGYA